MNRNSFKKWLMGGTLRLSKFQLSMALAVFYVILGFFPDGISSVVLTMGVDMPRMHKAGTHPLWFGIFVFMAIVLEIAPVTPPLAVQLVPVARRDQTPNWRHRQRGVSILHFDGGAGAGAVCLPANHHLAAGPNEGLN